MWTLSTLPDDTFALLLPFLPSTDVLALWKSGSPQLTRRLAQNVIRIELSDRIWHSTSRWPKLLSELPNLEHLSLFRDFAPLYIDSYGLSQQLKLLSPKLRTLRLSALGVLESLSNFADDTGTVTYTKYPRGSSQWMDFGAMFPRLESLSVYETARTNISYDSSDVAAFPDSITELHLNEFSLTKQEHLSLAVLPRNLQIFNATISIDYEGSLDTLFSQAPSGIRSLGLSDVIPSLTQLPRTLERFAGLYGEFDPTAAAELPSGLQELRILTIGSFEKPWTLSLPLNLTTLQLSPSATLTRQAIECLPKSITYITSPRLDSRSFGTNEKTDSVWPPSLLRLETKCSDPLICALLPTTLTTLTLSLEEESTLSKLPPGLTLLAVTCLKRLHISVPMPPKLSTLSLATHVDWKWLQEKNETCLFPPSLTSLKMLTKSRSLPTDEVLKSISMLPSLKVLEISSWSWETLCKLPRSLTHLELGIIASDTEITDYEKDLFADMPPNLNFLTIDRSEPMEDKTFSERSFATLSKLQRLSVIQVAPFPSAVLRNLPTSMQSLHIDLESLKDEDAVFLPPNATDLYVGESRSPLDLFALPHWPLSCVSAIYGDSMVRTPIDHPSRTRSAIALERRKLFPDPRVIISLPSE